MLEFSLKQRMLKWGERTFIVLVALAVIEYGSAGEIERNLAVIAFGLLATLSIFRPVGVAVARVRLATILLTVALVAYVLFQAFPLAAGSFANGAWTTVSDHVGPIEATVSVTPAMTLDALPTLVLPFLVFLCALTLFQGDVEAMLLWRALTYFGAGYAVYALVQHIFFPGQVFFQPKTFYVGSLTGTFINRNTAGTFFGLALLLNLGLLFSYLRNIQLSSLGQRLMSFDIAWRDRYGLVIVHAVLSLVVSLCLFLTQSRGAAASTFVAAAVALVLMAARRVTADTQSGALAKFRPVVAAVVGLGGLAALFGMFAGQVEYRMERQSVDDTRWCAYSSMFDAIKDHPIFGSGFGSFQDIFPLYRQADCAGVFGIWDRAHNSFLEGYLGLGLPFAVALVAGYAILITVFVRGLLARNKFRFAPVMALAALVLVSLHAIVDFSLQIPGLAVYFAALVAAGVSLSLSRSRPSPDF